MKHFIIILIFSLCVSVLTGCRGAGRDVVSRPDQGGHFPQFLAGTWRSEDQNWEITFDYTGNIVTIRHPFITVPVNIEEGFANEQGREGAYSIFIMGPCTAQYNRSKSELKVKIKVDYFEMVLPVGKMEGEMEDYLTGPLTEGNAVWKADWVNCVDLAGQPEPDPDLIPAEPVIFKKVLTE